MNRCEQITAEWVERLNRLAGVRARRDFPSEAGQPLPRALVTFEPSLGFGGEAVRQALLAREPAIDVAVADEHSIYLNPDCLEPGEEAVVLDCLRAVVGAALPTA